MEPETENVFVQLPDEPFTTKELLTKTMRILVPTDVSNLLWMSTQTVTLAFVGNYLGSVATAQYSASIIIFNMFGFSIIQGFGAAIDTISSQAYGRDARSPLVGETLQMALALDAVVGFFLCIFFMNIRPLAVLLFGEEVGAGVGTFLKLSPLYLLVQVLAGAMSKTMFAQKKPGIVAAANAAAAVVCPVANYFLTPLGLSGAVLALTITIGSACAAYIVATLYHPAIIIRLAPWPSPRLKDMEAWKEFFAVGVPSLLATCAEWWAFEVQAVLAGTISTTALAIHGVAMNLVNLLFSVALGICIAASVIIGNSLGGNRPVQAKQFAYFILIVDVAVGVLTAIIMITFGGHIARLFSKEADVVDGVESIMVYIVLVHVGDSLQFCLQGIFRGAGRPKEAGIAVMLTLWVIGVPASCIYVLVLHAGVVGCLKGLLIGFLFEIPLLFYGVTRFDWLKLARKAHKQAIIEQLPEELVTEDLSTPQVQRLAEQFPNFSSLRSDAQLDEKGEDDQALGHVEHRGEEDDTPQTRKPSPSPSSDEPQEGTHGGRLEEEPLPDPDKPTKE